MPKSKSSTRKSNSGTIALMVGTRKGAFILKSDKARRKWAISDGIMIGGVINDGDGPSRWLAHDSDVPQHLSLPEIYSVRPAEL